MSAVTSFGRLGTAISSLFARVTGSRSLVFAVADQAVFAGGNLLLNVLLARWMTTEHYGAFVVAYSWFLIPQNLYEAVVLEPMAIFGAGKYARAFKAYLARLYIGHALFGLFAGLFLGGVAAVASTSDSMTATAIAAAALFTPLLLTRWLIRQPFYVLGVPEQSVAGGFIYLVTGTLGYVLLRSSGTLDVVSAFAVMGLAGCLAALLLTIFLLKPNWNLRTSPEVQSRTVIQDHWQYSKWSIPARLLSWIPTNIYYIVLPLLAGFSASAGLRAVMNLALPVLMAITAMTALLVPTFVRAYENHGKPALTRRLLQAVQTGLLISGLYALVMVIFGRQIIHLLYDGKFDSVSTLPVLLALGLLPASTSVNAVLDAALRAAGGIKSAFLSKIIPTLFAVTVGIALTAGLDVLGALLAPLLTAVVLTLFLTRSYRSVPSKPANAHIGGEGA